MKMKIRFLLSAAFLCPLVITAAELKPVTDISGLWVAKLNGPMGEIEQVYQFKVDGNRLGGSVSGPFGDLPIVDGKIAGDQIEFTTVMNFFGQDRRLTTKGRIVGDELHVESPGPGGPPPGAPPPDGMGGPPPGAAAGRLPREVIARRGTPSLPRAKTVNFQSLRKIALPPVADLPPNGLVLTPPMGWNSWNKFHTRIDDKTVREMADAMLASGMKDDGYTYLNIDGGWQGERDRQGVLQANTNFPNMRALADYMHSQGLKLGLYSSPGPLTCAGLEGSYGHEEQDAQTWAAWGIDYLKYDWCSAARVFPNATRQMRPVYQKMAEALRATGRPIVYSICQYGQEQVWVWGPKAGGNLWRTTMDIFDTWPSMAAIGFGQNELADYAGPGHWNDPDMLEIGNGGMSDTEYRTHFSLWSLLAAPLIAGNDLRHMSAETKAILLNREVIAVDQDRLGQQGRRALREGEKEIWVRPLANGEFALGLFNRGQTEAELSFKWADLGLAKPAQVRDLWAHRRLETTGEEFKAKVRPHGVVLLRVGP